MMYPKNPGKSTSTKVSPKSASSTKSMAKVATKKMASTKKPMMKGTK
jgi:hypothetical protein